MIGKKLMSISPLLPHPPKKKPLILKFLFLFFLICLKNKGKKEMFFWGCLVLGEKKLYS